MHSSIPTRVLVVTDAVPPPPLLVTMMARTSAAVTSYDVHFRVVVLNPARAEFHLLHPGRRDEVDRAALVLQRWLDHAREVLPGAGITGTVSVRHDPVDAVEEVLGVEPVHEVWVHLREHPLARRLHHDLPHRLGHLDLPVTTLAAVPVPAQHP